MPPLSRAPLPHPRRPREWGAPSWLGPSRGNWLWAHLGTFEQRQSGRWGWPGSSSPIGSFTCSSALTGAGCPSKHLAVGEELGGAGFGKVLPPEAAKLLPQQAQSATHALTVAVQDPRRAGGELGEASRCAGQGQAGREKGDRDRTRPRRTMLQGARG